MKQALLIAPLLGLLAITAGCQDNGQNAPAPPGSITQGSGCSDTQANTFPYQPGCCDYQVAVQAEVTESGFNEAKLGPKPAPDHIHLSWAGPTDSSFTVNWRTDNETLASELLYGSDQAAVEAADGPSGNVERVTGHHLLYAGLVDGASSTRVHEVHVCGLSASSTYYYKVGGKGAWSAVYDTATGPAIGSGESYQLAVLGDSRDDPAVHAQIQEAIAAQGVDFELFTGDVVNIGGLQAQWNDWFEASSGSFALQDALARTPFMVTNGNHENLAINFLAQFAMPQSEEPGEAGAGEEYFSFDYGNARILSLNDTPESSALGEAQLGWLDRTLGEVDRSKQPWLFVMHHRSTYSCGGSHHSDLDLRAAWQPIFDAHKVDLVLSGHDHLYERSKPMRGLSGSDGIVATDVGPDDTPVSESGTLYVVAGGAGAPLYGADGSCNHTHLTESVRNYIIIAVQGRTLHYTAYRLDGTVLDELEYTK